MPVLFLTMSGLALGGALGAHNLQLHRVSAAAASERLAEERARTEAIAAEEAKAARVAKEADAKAKAEAQRLEEAAKRGRYTQFPERLILLRKTALAQRLVGPRADLARQTAQLQDQQERRTAAAPTASLVSQIVSAASIGLLVALAGMSLSQLIPSFRVLGTGLAVVDVLLAVGLVAVEVFVALLLAEKLRPAGGFGSLGAKLNVAFAAVFALVVMGMQYTWAPAHDTIPLRAQIAQAEEQLTVDMSSRGDPILITTDEQAVKSLQSQLDQVTSRDQGLAIVVTLGADVSAYPALLGVGYLRSRRRRRLLDGETATTTGAIAALDRQINEMTAAATLELQAELDQLGIDPALALQAATAAMAAAPLAGLSRTPRPEPAPPRATPAAQTVAPAEGPPGAEALEVIDLTTTDDPFASAPEPTDRRWTDPL